MSMGIIRQMPSSIPTSRSGYGEYQMPSQPIVLNRVTAPQGSVTNPPATTKPAEGYVESKPANPWGEFKDRETFVDLHMF